MWTWATSWSGPTSSTTCSSTTSTTRRPASSADANPVGEPETGLGRRLDLSGLSAGLMTGPNDRPNDRPADRPLRRAVWIAEPGRFPAGPSRGGNGVLKAYIVRRLLSIIPTLLIVGSIVFFVMR